MRTKFCDIGELQSDTKELESVIDALHAGDLTKPELNRMKRNLLDFLGELRSDLKVVIGYDYVDRAYRDSYYDYYATKRSNYDRSCLRMSFFRPGFNSNIDLDKTDNIIDNYLGFLVLRPLIKCIGRNVINPEAKSAYTDMRICKVSVDTSCFGVKLRAVGFPHASQDSETMTCAQTAIWSLLEYFGNKYTSYHPTVPSEIERILEPFAYERQLPSKGLTYNQISVALRKFGFGPKIYKVIDTEEGIAHFKELFACYIESGLPLAVALTSKSPSIGHAIVCIGTENIDRHIVTEYPEQLSGKTVYSWNKAVANQNFIFNDDNFPNYQVSSLDSPCDRYVARKEEQWKSVRITQFIAPLYSKVYMEADTAIELSKKIVETVLDAGDGMVMRTLLTSSRTLREHISQISSFTSEQRIALLQLRMPKFVWVTELCTLEEFYKGFANTLLLLDATGARKASMARNTIFMLSNRYYYKFNDKIRLFERHLTKLPQSFESFNGNLK